MITVELRDSAEKIFHGDASIHVEMGGDLQIWRKVEDGSSEMIAIFAAGTWFNAIKAEVDA